MKKICLLMMALLLTSPAVLASSNTRGLLWMKTTEPVYITSDGVGNSPKMGVSTSVNILRLVTSGDGGIKKAIECGNIKKG